MNRDIDDILRDRRPSQLLDSEPEASDHEEWEDDSGANLGLTTENPDLTDSQINELYLRGENRIITQDNDFLLPNLLVSLQDERFLNLSPSYQRRLRWSDEKRSKLIESLLMNVPVPPVFLFESELGRYEVMDGQQRLTTIRAFFGNEFKLDGLKKWACLNGRSYHELPSAIQRGLLRRSISAVILLTESGKTPADALELRRAVFERLNTGGERLNPQEIRNAIYAGPLNELTAELSRTPLFTKIWGIPPQEAGEPMKVSVRLERNTLYRKMVDRELVLRVFALLEHSHVHRGMQRTLDAYMARHRDAVPEEIARLRSEFITALEIAHGVWGEDVFRLMPSSKKARRGTLSKTLYDATMVSLIEILRSSGINRLEECRADVLDRAPQIRQRLAETMQDPELYRMLTGVSNTRKLTMDRMALLRDVLAAE